MSTTISSSLEERSDPARLSSASRELADEVKVLLPDGLIDELLAGARTDEEITGPGGLLSALTKRLVERAMEVELTDHLGYELRQVRGEPEPVRSSTTTFRLMATRPRPKGSSSRRTSSEAARPALDHCNPQPWRAKRSVSIDRVRETDLCDCRHVVLAGDTLRLNSNTVHRSAAGANPAGVGLKASATTLGPNPAMLVDPINHCRCPFDPWEAARKLRLGLALAARARVYSSSSHCCPPLAVTARQYGPPTRLDVKPSPGKVPLVHLPTGS